MSESNFKPKCFTSNFHICMCRKNHVLTHDASNLSQVYSHYIMICLIDKQVCINLKSTKRTYDNSFSFFWILSYQYIYFIWLNNIILIMHHQPPNNVCEVVKHVNVQRNAINDINLIIIITLHQLYFTQI